MNNTETISVDIALLAFLDELKTNLRAVREEQSAFRLSLRRACEHFQVSQGCLAVLSPDRSRAKLISVVPRESNWDLDCLAAFLRKQRPRIPSNVIVAPVYRRGRLWAALALRCQRSFRIPDDYLALARVAKVVSEAIESVDEQRNIEVRSQIDRKMLEQLRPQDLFYQMLHGLRSLTLYDHSSALLICNHRDHTLELVAEQIAWRKGKSRRVGLKLPLDEDTLALLQNNAVFGYNRSNGGWKEWSGKSSCCLANLLDYNQDSASQPSDRRELVMLCAPLMTRDGVLGVLKIAGCYPGLFDGYEADLVRRFTPLAALAIQQSQRASTLEARMLETEKKHAVANLLRGVSHDVNNALGCVLPLVQQIEVDIRAGSLQPDTLSEDLRQIEESIRTCRRIFGGMLALARHAGQCANVQANVRRACDSTLAVLRDALERQRIQLEVRIEEPVPNIKAGQGDLEQVLLNLATNARDAMPAGGKLSIRAEPEGDNMAIIVEDNGCGIPPDVMSRIQEPFFTTKRNGNGLGLSICRSIVWNAGGRMNIESEPGSGTRIRVLIPAVRP